MLGFQDCTGTIEDYHQKIHESIAGQSRTLVIHRIYIDYVGDILSALFLSQVIYWSSRTDDEGRWFWKTYDQWKEELGLSAKQVRRICNKLETMGILEKKVKKTGEAPVVHYRMKWPEFNESFSEFLEGKSKVPKGNYRNFDSYRKELSKAPKGKDPVTNHRVHAKSTSNNGFFSGPSRRETKLKRGVKDLFDVLCRKGWIKATASHKRWIGSFQNLAREHSVDEVIAVVEWYVGHIGEDFVPDVYSGTSFEQKYYKIKRAMSRTSRTANGRRGGLSEEDREEIIDAE